jgi:hypothetical protein
MRLFTLASISFLAVLVFAQTSKTDASTDEDLLAEFASLPKCVVRMKNASLGNYA